MSHHGEEPIGPTGEFPDGKLGPQDDGAIRFRIGCDKGRVVVDFGKRVQWFALLPHQALELSKILRKQAKKATR